MYIGQVTADYKQFHIISLTVYLYHFFRLSSHLIPRSIHILKIFIFFPYKNTSKTDFLFAVLEVSYLLLRTITQTVYFLLSFIKHSIKNARAKITPPIMLSMKLKLTISNAPVKHSLITFRQDSTIPLIIITTATVFNALTSTPFAIGLAFLSCLKNLCSVIIIHKDKTFPTKKYIKRRVVFSAEPINNSGTIPFTDKFNFSNCTLKFSGETAIPAKPTTVNANETIIRIEKTFIRINIILLTAFILSSKFVNWISPLCYIIMFLCLS